MGSSAPVTFTVHDLGKALFLIASGYAPIETPTLTERDRYCFTFGEDALPYNRVYRQLNDFTHNAKLTRRESLPTPEEFMDYADKLWSAMENETGEHRL